MNQQEATEFVIRELGKQHPRNGILQQLCEATSLSWTQAENFVRQVEAEHAEVIARKQSPVILAIGAGFILAGLVLAGWTLYASVQGQDMRIGPIPIPYSGNVVYLLSAAAMIGGGLRGIWSILVRLWNS